jgi:hypothetical protein
VQRKQVLRKLWAVGTQTREFGLSLVISVLAPVKISKAQRTGLATAAISTEGVCF